MTPTPVERMELLRRCFEERDKQACSVMNGTGVVDGVKDDPKLTAECPLLKNSGTKLLDLTWKQAQNLPRRCPNLFQHPAPVPSAFGGSGGTSLIGIGALGVLAYYAVTKFFRKGK